MTDPEQRTAEQFLTVAEVASIVLPMARWIGHLAERVKTLEADRDAKIPRGHKPSKEA